MFKILELILSDKLYYIFLSTYCYMVNIRKGRKLIVYTSSYTNHAKDGDVRWGTIDSFSFDRISDTIVSYSIGIKFSDDIKAPFSYGYYNISEVKDIIAAQPLLMKNFKNLK